MNLSETVKDMVEFIIVEKGEKYFHTLDSEIFKYINIEGDNFYNRSKCLNIGGFISTGQFIIFHDNDLPVNDSFFKNCVQMTKTHDYFSTYSTIYHLDEKSTNKVFENPIEHNFGYDTKLSFNNYRSYGVGGMYGASVCVESEKFKNIIEGFNEGFLGWGGEDEEFRIRAKYHCKCEGILNQNLIHIHHSPIHGPTQNPHYENNLKLLNKTISDYKI